MAKGDIIINGIVATGAFQPAAGVEVMLTTLGDMGAGDELYLHDGIVDAWLKKSSTDTVFSAKVGITNAVYIRYVYANNFGYSGVQVK